MKKLQSLLLLSAIILLPLWSLKAKDESGQSVDIEKILGKQIENTLVGLTLGRYLVSSDRFQQIYRKEHTMYGLDLTRIIISGEQHNLALSLEAKRFSKTGVSTFTKEETKITLVPFSISAKYLVQIENFIPFVGLGLDYYKYKEESDIHETSDSTDGYHIQGGCYFQIPGAEFFKIKLFMKITQAYAKENNITVDLGGFEYGVTLVYGFNL